MKLLYVPGSVVGAGHRRGARQWYLHLSSSQPDNGIDKYTNKCQNQVLKAV